MDIYTLRKLAGREEIDYQFLMGALQEYSRPREKITLWLKSRELIRVKKGLYIFGKNVAQETYSKEVLANQIYGPSAISLTHALSFYGLIPEKTTVITSITNKRNKKFFTPIGNYFYYFLNNDRYAVGIELLRLQNGESFLIATPEKALCDQVYLIDYKIKLISNHETEKYLFQDLRLNESEVLKFDLEHLIEINDAYKTSSINAIINYLKKRNKNAKNN